MVMGWASEREKQVRLLALSPTAISQRVALAKFSCHRKVQPTAYWRQLAPAYLSQLNCKLFARRIVVGAPILIITFIAT
jgi:hypothetical protein